jgi:hypothetical protein
MEFKTVEIPATHEATLVSDPPMFSKSLIKFCLPAFIVEYLSLLSYLLAELADVEHLS